MATGDEPVRAENRQLVLTERTGIVLVLIPGGPFWMGAQSDTPKRHNYETHEQNHGLPVVESDEGPEHEVLLSAYFLSKYEMTQGQWQRLTGRNPSLYGPHHWSREYLQDASASSLLHPVEQVSWEDCMTWLPRAGLPCRVKLSGSAVLEAVARVPGGRAREKTRFRRPPTCWTSMP